MIRNDTLILHNIPALSLVGSWLVTRLGDWTTEGVHTGWAISLVLEFSSTQSIISFIILLWCISIICLTYYYIVVFLQSIFSKEVWTSQCQEIPQSEHCIPSCALSFPWYWMQREKPLPIAGTQLDHAWLSPVSQIVFCTSHISVMGAHLGHEPPSPTSYQVWN